MVCYIRYLILTLCVMSSSVVYITRSNLNLAIVAMVEPISASVESSVTNNSERKLQTCPVEHETSKLSHVHNSIEGNTSDYVTISQERYKWDQKLQGLVLGSFYYTYIILQIPSGMLAEKFGGKRLIALALIGSSVINALTPVIASYSVVMILSRVLLGVLQAPLYPACFVMCNTWFKLNERAFAFAMTEAGACMGTIVTYFTAGYISEILGWPWVFYTAGMMALVPFVVFLLLATDEPSAHPCISARELAHHDSESPQMKGAKRVTTPWLGIFTCPAVLAVAFFKFSTGWTATTLASKLPAYLNDIMHEDISSNGVINAVMNIIVFTSMGIGGSLSEKIIQRKYASRTNTRKLYSIVSGFGSALCLLLIPLAGCNRLALLTILYVGSFCLGSASGSDVPIASEMSIHFPATLYSMLNMIQMSSGIITPSFVGFLLEDSTDLRASWALVFYFSSFLITIATVIFIVFASAERQKFDFYIDDDETFNRPRQHREQLSTQ